MSDFMIVKTAKGVEFKVSPEDYERVSALTWYVNSRGYVVRTGRDESGKRRQVPLHRFIVGAKHGDPVLVDHESRDTLDNRRKNLRVCNKAQNGHNQGPQRTNTSGYKGVTRTSSGSWMAQIRCNGKRIHIGSFRSREVAAHEYNKVALRLHGEFAVLNPVGGVYVD